MPPGTDSHCTECSAPGIRAFPPLRSDPSSMSCKHEPSTLPATSIWNTIAVLAAGGTLPAEPITISSMTKGSSILTVGESQGFAARGGIINLTVEGDTVHFEVNQTAAERARLKISSKVLSMAKIVKE